MADKDFKSIAELQVYLNNISSKLTKYNTRTVLNSAGEMIRNIIEESFDNETDPVTNQKWKSISSVSAMASYNKGKLKGMKENAHIKSGKRLKKSFTNKYGAGGSKKILQESGALAENWRVGSSNMRVDVYNNSKSNGFPYGMSHVTGSDNLFGKGIHLEARNFLPIDVQTGNLTNKVEQKVLDMVLNYIENEVLK